MSIGAANRLAIITPSYHGDFGRCSLLCRSMDALVTGNWHHYIIVETVDLALFRPLANNRRTILEMESLLPSSFRHLARVPIINNRSLWHSWRTGFMIGWHVQQIVKLEMAFQVEAEGLLYCDSDVFFVRPFKAENLWEAGKFRFFRTEKIFDESVISHPKYSTVSARQLGIVGKLFPCPTYVENLVPWHRATVKTLCNHVAQISGRDWRVTLGRDIFISEYTLYGLYVENVMEDKSHLQTSHEVLCKTIWHRGAANENSLTEFCSDLNGSEVAVGVQSFAGISVEQLDRQFQRALKRV